ncbi:hypothetical protein Esi_0103_0069 [Ectocarpus siliculosus]|uniref:Uncharacterized protein n=1 Tax=Ectocarpus siliculosus TaxID=2880 RepID=D8LCH2_ECTSI|nr:hypothetical protein Esi_0103_0069 [Ectocarpus siliculosus]|eukprot:CBN78208.1 hypothetical protein Esi_0103_0069 [Ectocarpus siliculosus]
MENRALRLPRAEPLLHVPVSAIVEFVSNRSEAEVLLRIGDLGHEFDHLTRTLVQWLEHEQHLTADGCLQEEQQPVEDSGESLVLSLVPLAHQARVVNRHGVRVLQEKITECLQQLQRYMDAVQVFANQNASFSQELRLCGLGDRAEQRRRLAETESALVRRLAKFLGGCDSFYDEQPLPLAMQFAAAEEAAARTAVPPAETEAVKFKQPAPVVAPREGAAASLPVAAPQEEEEEVVVEEEEEEHRKKKRHAGAGAGKSCPADGHDDEPKSNLGSRTATTGGAAGRKRPLPPTGSRQDLGDRDDGGGRGRKRKEREEETAAAAGSGVGGVAAGSVLRGARGAAAGTEGAANDGRSAMLVSGDGGASGFVLRVPGEAAEDGGDAQAGVAVAAARGGLRACSAEKPPKLKRQRQQQQQQASEAPRADEVAGMQERGRKSGGVEEEEHEEEEEEEGKEEEEEEEEEEEDMPDTAETVEDSVIPEAAVGPRCWGSQDGADEAGGTDPEAGVMGGGGSARVGRRAGEAGRDSADHAPR